MSSTTLSAVEDGVAILTLNRPGAMNAFDAGTARLLVDRRDALAADCSFRVLVVAGNGSAFSVGGDFNAVLTLPSTPSSAAPRPVP